MAEPKKGKTTKATKSIKVGQGQKGRYKPPGTGKKKGDMHHNTKELLHRIQSQMDVQDAAYGETLMQTAYKMIHDKTGNVPAFVQKDLILGLLKLVTPQLKAMDVSVDQPPMAITFNTNLMARPMKVINANPNDQLPSAPDPSQIPQ